MFPSLMVDSYFDRLACGRVKKSVDMGIEQSDLLPEGVGRNQKEGQAMSILSTHDIALKLRLL